MAYAALSKTGLTEARKKAKEQAERIIQAGTNLARNWIEFYLDVVDFQQNDLAGRPKWELAGYRSWEDFERRTCSTMQQSRATFYASIKTVKALPPATIKKLGKTKSSYAARLKKHNKLTAAVQEKLEKLDVEGAKKFTRKTLGETSEGRIRLVLSLKESQHDAFVAQIERVQKIMGTERMEDALDLLIGHLATMSDHEIKMEFAPEG